MTWPPHLWLTILTVVELCLGLLGGVFREWRRLTARRKHRVSRLFHASTRKASSRCLMLLRTVHSLWNLYGNPDKNLANNMNKEEETNTECFAMGEILGNPHGCRGPAMAWLFSRGFPAYKLYQLNSLSEFRPVGWHIAMTLSSQSEHFEVILPKGSYLPCVSMAGRPLFAGYPWFVKDITEAVNRPLQNKAVLGLWSRLLTL